jgi:predicted phage tail protein
MKKGRPRPPSQRCPRPAQAAVSHIAVSKALLISGMFMPKLALAAAALAAAAFFALLPVSMLLVGATSVARSHDPISWERATEKNRNT